MFEVQAVMIGYKVHRRLGDAKCLTKNVQPCLPLLSCTEFPDNVGSREGHAQSIIHKNIQPT